MTKHARSIQILNVEGLSGTADQPLTVRVEALIRRAILSGNLAGSARLPSSRILAHDLNVSRHTVEHALDGLVSAGFITRKRGSGSFVAPALPTREQPPRGEEKSAAATAQTAVEPTTVTLSKRGAAIAVLRGRRAFRCSAPHSPRRFLRSKFFRVKFGAASCLMRLGARALITGRTAQAMVCPNFATQSPRTSPEAVPLPAHQIR